MKRIQKLIIATTAVVFFVGMIISCVPLNQYKAVQKQNNDCVSKRDSLQDALHSSQTKVTELQSELDKSTKKIADLISDTTTLGSQKRNFEEQNIKLNELNNNLSQNQSKLIKENALEAKRLLEELQVSREDLQRREDNLDALRVSLEKERQNLEKLKSELGLKTSQLTEKDAELRDLKEIMRKKDSATLALKNKISNALMGFAGEGLRVEFRNGKIYVSVDDQLLFKVGQADVNPRGVEALVKLAKILEANKELNIMVEGHTDNTGTEKFNWELSTKRALSITYILIDNSTIDKSRVSACGRGQFYPIDPANTPEARKKNRRSEIILTPQLSELYDMIKESK